MKSLRSRTIESDNEKNLQTDSNDDVFENRKTINNLITKKRKLRKNMTNETVDNSDAEIAEGENVIKVEKKKSRKSRKDKRESNSNETYNDNGVDMSIYTKNKRKSKKILTENESETNLDKSRGKLIERKEKRASLRITDDMNDQKAERDENISKSKKRKSKKNNTVIENDLLETDDDLKENTKVRKRKSRKNELIDDSQEVKIEEKIIKRRSKNNTISNKIKTPKLSVNLKTENLDKNSKKKNKHIKHFSVSSTSLSSPGFENIVTSTTIKPKKLNNTSFEAKTNADETFEIDAIILEPFNKTPENNKRISRRETFDIKINADGIPEEKNLNETFDKTQENNRQISRNKEAKIEEKSIRRETFNKSEITKINDSIPEDVIDISDRKNICIPPGDSPVRNTSGDWKVETSVINISDDEVNATFEVENKENNKSPANYEQNLLSPNVKSGRKKWLKFERNSLNANSVLEQISSPVLKKKLKFSDDSKAHEKPVKPNPSRVFVPNFALIHKKVFEKMENLQEYSERKKQRAQTLLSSTKRKSLSDTKKQIPEKPKSSRELFGLQTDVPVFNRFGFKITEHVKKSEIIKPVVKPSVFARSDVVTIANKNKAVDNTTNKRRNVLKGVRTNRRFDLLMKMRNNTK